ncbi:Calcineurin B homologous protein 2, partial [Oryzias melastigma]
MTSDLDLHKAASCPFRPPLARLPPAGQRSSVRTGDHLDGGGQQDGLQQLQPEPHPDGQQLMGEKGFSAAHLLRLHERFELLDKDSRGHLRPEDFEEIRELTENPVGGRIIGAFFPPEKETLDFPSFVRILAHFRPTGKNRSRGQNTAGPANSRTGKLKFAFKLYDQDRDGKISRDELLQVLRAMLGLQVTEEQLQSIAERASRRPTSTVTAPFPLMSSR